MGKIAFVFPGQGSQFPGMGKDLYENNKEFRDTFKEADEILGYKISRICFEGTREDLDSTDNSQVAIVTFSTALGRLMESLGIESAITAGLSLGEYSALIEGGALSFRDGLKLVRQRGQFMKKASEKTHGAMAAVLLSDNLDIVQNEIEALQEEGIITIANFNSPGQVVLSGETQLVEKAAEGLKARGIKRIVRLPVSGAFHTKLMEDAALNLKEVLCKTDIHSLNESLVSNVTGRILCKEDNLRDILVQHMVSPVLWQKSVETMIDQGVDTFIELGPGKALSGFIRKIDRNIKVFNIQDQESLKKTIEEVAYVQR